MRSRPPSRLLPAPLAMLCVLLLTSAPPLLGQEPGVKIVIGDVGIGLGDVPRIDGLRINFRDRALERVRGVNLTLWDPREGSRGIVQGLAVGLPVTGAYDLSGVALGVGVGAERNFRGIGAGLLGVGAGEDATGVFVGGLGVGGGDRVDGVMIGGLGVGAGGALRGLAVGGLGVGTGETVSGIALGGLGVGAGGDVRGILVGGLGVGAGEDATGILVGGLGVGAGEDVRGVALGGLGVGVGGEARGLLIGGAGVGAAELTGVAVGGLGVGIGSGRGLVIAPGYFKVDEEGSFRGLSISAFNDVRGVQRGVSIGLLNIAGELHGWQIGLVNIARNKDSFSVLPLVNHSP